ncbi:MAG: hypothetical protein ABIP06_06495 [Pyrinomonadaceae bacterium]
MQFPYIPKRIFVRGGKLVEITGISHTLDRPQDGYSRDYWYYLGRTQWSDNGKTDEKPRHVYPYDLCYDEDAEVESKAEINALSKAMMDYLRKHGTWCDGKSKHEGWYATKR